MVALMSAVGASAVLSNLVKFLSKFKVINNRESEPPSGRNRLVECFFGAACIAPEPRLAACREVLAKIGSLLVHLDDVYDVYGTLDELRAFTDAIGRWDNAFAAGAAALPESMKAMYAAIWTTSTGAADRVMKDQGYDVLSLYKKAWHELCKAFLVEVEWKYQSYRPRCDEYLDNGWITSTGPLLLLHAFPTLNLNLNEAQQQVNACLGNQNNGGDGSIKYPRLVELSSTIFRLCNDCATHKADSEQGDDEPSSIACYMREIGTSEEDARGVVQNTIVENWKELNNEACTGGWNLSSPYGMANICINLARIFHIYHNGDSITSPTDSNKPLVKDLIFIPIVICDTEPQHEGCNGDV
ncbi:hypothetical protein ACQ4PT_048419 [Festuca glaucescens]